MALDARLDQPCNGECLHRPKLVARFDSGQAEQIEDQRVQPLSLFLNALEESTAVFDVVNPALQQRLDAGGDYGQRRLELV